MQDDKRNSGGADLPRPRRAVPPPPVASSSQASQRRTTSGRSGTPQNIQPRSVVRKSNLSDTQPLPPPRQEPVNPVRPRQIKPPVQNGRSPAPSPNHHPPRHPKKTKKPHKKASVFKKAIISLLTAAAVLFGLYSFVALRCISSLQKAEPGERLSSDAGCLEESYVRNILLIGSDSRDGTRGRSDTMMLVSINQKTDRITLVSFLRDSYVTIPGGHGENRLNAAYSFGGPELLMDTIQNNYRIVIDDYVEVNFISFASIIDAVGGVEITVTDAEAEAINNILRDEVNALMGDPVEADWLSGGGTYLLNGKQALSYSRIRKVGNADFERTERQREVISGMVQQLKSSGISGISTLASEALPNVITNISTPSLYLFSLRAPFLLGYQFESLQIPADGTWSGETINGASVLSVDFEANRKILKETLYATE